MQVSSFASIDTVRLAEMEFYLVEELDFHLIVFHPYRSLVQLTGRDGGAYEPGGRQRRAAMLEMDDTALQMAWFVLNDTFRSSLCLVHPPHLVALAAVYLALSLHPPPALLTAMGRDAPVPAGTKSAPAGGKTDPVTFLSRLDIDHSLILEIVQELVSLYELWHRLEVAPDSAVAGRMGSRAAAGGAKAMGSADERVWQVITRMKQERIRDLQEMERQKMAGSWKK